MKTTLTKRALLGIATIAAAGALSASAMGMPGMMGANLSPDEQATRQTQMFQSQASLIGASVDEVKTAWAEGKDFKTLATEKGVTADQLKAKMQAARTAEMKTQLQNLVTKGVITQAQADKRLATMQTKSANKKDSKRGGHGMKGMMGGFGF
ncbi:MAG: hypothetical protein KBC21_01400 [Candidatus Pacebacteria bacterium]|nr:hypothetical protein [Candidatus Paceibacterota bacterium]